MGDINGQESISVSFYNSLLGIGGHSDGEGETARSPQPDTRQVRMSSVPSNYGTVSRLIDETSDRTGRNADREQNLSGLTKRLAEMFEQKQALVAELKNERIKSETIESERDDLQRKLDRMSVDYDQALAKVEQSKAARERATQFMEEAKEATRLVISESRSKVADSEDARAEAERAYEDEHNLRRNLEQLLQEMRAESDVMSDKVTTLTSELRDMTIAKNDATQRLSEAEQDLAALHAENEAHISRIDHLTGRNELLARNLQSINLEHGELRKQFDATAVSNAALSADYEALMRRCTDAENERDRLRIESISQSSFSASEAEELKAELAKARNVIILLRPIIEKAGAGDLRKGDIRLLDERLTDYEQAVSSYSADSTTDFTAPQAVVEPQPVAYQPYQAPSAGNAGYASGYGNAGDTGSTYGGYDSATPASTIDPMTTADLYAALEMEVDGMGDDLTDAGTDTGSQQVESVSFINMFGKPEGDDAGTTVEAPSYEFDTFDDYGDIDELDDFDDLDEPEGLGDADGTSYRTQETAPAGDYDFDVSDVYDDDDSGSTDDFAFPQDLKRSTTQIVDSLKEENPYDEDDLSDFELDNLSDFNAIMADFAHYTADSLDN